MQRLVVLFFLFSIFISLQSFGQSSAPVFRGRLGINMLNFQVGNTFSNEPLGSLMTFNPTILWNLPTFRARMGVHFMGDFASKYGFMPISGMGFSSYFYPFGLSTVYEIANDGTLYQKSRPGPYVFMTLTPVNFNINASKEQTSSGSALSFSAYMIELGMGGGYDYPVSTNMVLAGELQYRFASAQERTTKETISYSGMGLMLTFSTSYH
jgi:hypothetical protein